MDRYNKIRITFSVLQKNGESVRQCKITRTLRKFGAVYKFMRKSLDRT